MEAENGEEALIAAATQRPDILMDIQLRSWMATRRRAASRPIQRSRTFRSSRSPLIL
jgi:hypothetical protein